MIGVTRGIITLLLMLLFLAMILWAYSKRRKPTFDAMARLPLEDESSPAPRDTQS